MTQNSQLADYSPQEFEPAGAAEPNQPKAVNPLMLIHSLLRGRYWLAILLAVVGAAIGGPIGYFAIKPLYKSTGVIEVRSSLPRVMFETEQNEPIRNFGPFLLTQVELLRSSRVVGLAMQDPEWRALGRGLTPEAVTAFNKSLEVTTPRNSELIYVIFTDDDAKAAATAVKALIRAYERVFVDMEIGTGTPLMTALNDLKRQQTSDLKVITDRIASLAGEFDSSALQQIYDTKLKLWLEAEVEHKRSQAQSSLWGNQQPDGSKPEGAAVADPIEQTIAAMQRSDPWLQQLEQEKRQLEREGRELALRLGQNHPKVAAGEQQLSLLNEDIAKRNTELRAMANGAPSPSMPLPGATATADPRLIEQTWRVTADTLKTEMDALGQRKKEIDSLRQEEVAARELLEMTKTRILQINVESSNSGGRLSILTYGDIPLQPDKDRRLALTGGGMFAGASLGVGIVLLLGFMDRRLLHIDATRAELRPVDRLLGVLPEIEGGVIDLASGSDAAYCVHHIRAMLQIRQSATGHKVIGITSSSPGDGKTTLVINLGLSLAATGVRTILVDCDFDGGGLTSRMHRMLLKSQSITPVHGVRKAEEQPGLHGVLRGVPLEDAIMPTPVPNLFLLPLGAVPGTVAGQFSPTSLRSVLARLAMGFDSVMVDTGPILGSIETSIIAAEAQGMILVVSRGGDKTSFRRASDMLAHAGAGLEGVVFNRALGPDLAKSVYRSSASIRSVRQDVPAAEAARSEAARSRSEDSDRSQPNVPAAPTT